MFAQLVLQVFRLVVQLARQLLPSVPGRQSALQAVDCVVQPAPQAVWLVLQSRPQAPAVALQLVEQIENGEV